MTKGSQPILTISAVVGSSRSFDTSYPQSANSKKGVSDANRLTVRSPAASDRPSSVRCESDEVVPRSR